MTKTKTPHEDKDEEVIIERMNKALKRMMDTPPETHKEMVERRRGHVKPVRNPKKD
jgi:hypothetical protein